MQLSDQEGELQDGLRELLGHLNRAVQQRRRTNPGALPPADFATLMQLRRHDGARSGDLAADEGTDASTMSRRICSLEERGLVAREPDPADGRASIVRLTEAGRAAADAEAAGRVAVISAALQPWDRAELTELTRMIRQLNDAFSRSREAGEAR